MFSYFDFSKDDDRVFIPKAKTIKKSCTFDKFNLSKIKSAPSLDKYAKWCKENNKSKK